VAYIWGNRPQQSRFRRKLLKVLEKVMIHFSLLPRGLVVREEDLKVYNA
jgi:hypothetical protein